LIPQSCFTCEHWREWNSVERQYLCGRTIPPVWVKTTREHYAREPGSDDDLIEEEEA
jgi:hypothetical protein